MIVSLFQRVCLSLCGGFIFTSLALSVTFGVLIESGDADSTWVTVGVSHDIIEASWQGLVDSVVYKLYRDEEGQRKLRDLR